MFTALFYLKVAIAPVIVLSVSYLQRRFGDRFGGWLIGLPITTGPFLLIIGIQEGVVFAGKTAHGVLLGQMALIVFCWAYARAALRNSWLVALSIGTLACLATGLIVTSFKFSIWVSAPALILLWLLAMRLWPKDGSFTQKISRGDDGLDVALFGARGNGAFGQSVIQIHRHLAAEKRGIIDQRSGHARRQEKPDHFLAAPDFL